MKKYIRLLPVMLFPYVYLIFLAVTAFITMSFGEWGLAVGAVFIIAALVCSVSSAVFTARGESTAYEAAKMNLIVKCVQIPAYIFHFLLGAAGTVMSVWGIGVIMFVVIIDVITIVLTGINAVGCVVRICRENVIGSGMAVLMGICSFIFCIDVGTAVFLFVKGGRSRQYQMY